MEEQEHCKFTQLSDCLMLEILSFLDATSLYFLSKTCTYFENIIKDRKLWKYIDARRKPNTEEKIDYCIERIHPDTTHLLLKADSRKGQLLSFDTVSALISLNLTILSLENQRFCGKKICLQDFPSTLEELSLRKTHVRNGKSFFQHSFASKRNLRVLILDECNWLDSSFIMSVSKFPSLEIISIVKCNKLHHNIVPYLSVARQGCKMLKVLDCRFNTVGNDFLRTFDENENILALYFQSMRSYQQDYDKNLLRNVEKIQNLSSDDMDLISQSIINNRSLYNYKFALGVDYNIEELPKSLLYEHPYPPCTCKYQENRENLEKGKTDPEDDSNQNLMKVDDFMNFRSAAPQKFLCKKHSNEVENLPKEFKDFFVQNQMMFHAGHTDSDSDSDSDFDSDDCCMYGMGKAQQLILLRLNEIDSEGNLPQPEVIDLNAENRMEVEIIRIDPFANSRNEAAIQRQIRQNEEIMQMGSPERSIDNRTTDGKSNKNISNPTLDTSSSSPNIPGTSQDSTLNSSLELASTSHKSPRESSKNISQISMPSTSRNTPSPSRSATSSNSTTIHTNTYTSSTSSTSIDTPSTSSSSIDMASINQSIPSTSKDSLSTSKIHISTSQSSSSPITMESIMTRALSPDISDDQNLTECLDSSSKVTVTGDHSTIEEESYRVQCNEIDSQGVVETNTSMASDQHISTNENKIATSESFSDNNTPDSLTPNESGSLTESKDKQNKGVKRSLPSHDLFCEPSTSRAAYDKPERKKPKLENASCSSSSSDGNTKQESKGGDKLTEKNFEPKEPIWPDLGIDIPNDLSPEPPNLEAPQNVIANPYFGRPEVIFHPNLDRRNEIVDLPLREILIRMGPPQEEHKQTKLKLRRLSLRGYRKITDLALNYLRNLKIDLLDLTHTSVTRKGIEQFLTYNPNCRVIHKDFCVCKPRIPS